MANIPLPKLECDLVMRGGITSGLVYPRAVAEIARHYIFRSIGGTSAGAIAATVTAAAEYGRRTGHSSKLHGKTVDPFTRLAAIPEELSGRPGGQTTALMQLFVPQRATQPLHRLLLVFLDGKTYNDTAARFQAFFLALILGFPLAAFLGALPGFLIGATVFKDEVRALLAVPAPQAAFAIHLASGLAMMVLACALSFFLLALARRTIWLIVGIVAVICIATSVVLAVIYTQRFDPLMPLRMIVVDAGWLLSLVGVLLTTFIAFSGAILGATLGAIRRVRKALPRNMYGICSGVANRNAYGVPGLTDWLHGIVQNVAGRPRNGPPLTVGDLWHLDRYGPSPDRAMADRAEINLALVTSNITLGLSHRFPRLETQRGSLYFRKADFDRLFPPTIVAWMIDKAQTPEIGVDVPEGTYRIPASHNLPILLGARLSMSFPFLLSAVPLYVVDWADEEHASRTGRYPLRACHFSDGGLTSNFPIQIFDAPIPSRPTFGINLLPSHTSIEVVSPASDAEPNLEVVAKHLGIAGGPAPAPGRYSRGRPAARGKGTYADEASFVWMPSDNAMSRDRILRFNRFHEQGEGSVAGFSEALFDTARNWADTEKMFMPGYRDRIVHVSLSDSEGGLNLNMDPHVIQAIGRRGEIAGRALVARFAATEPGRIDPLSGAPVKLGWDNHRWVRYRAFMASVEDMMLQFALRWQGERDGSEPPAGGGTPLPELLQQSQKQTPNMDFTWQSNEQFSHAVNLTDWLVTNAMLWRTLPGHNFASGAPVPTPLLRMVPPDEKIEGAGGPNSDGAS